MPLSNSEIKSFTERLQQQREQLRARIRDELADSQEDNAESIGGPARDDGDNSVADLEMDLSLSGLQRDADASDGIEQALARIREGTFGVCEQCGKDIGRERLDAYPTAQRCIDCETRRERDHAGGADLTPSL